MIDLDTFKTANEILLEIELESLTNITLLKLLI